MFERGQWFGKNDWTRIVGEGLRSMSACQLRAPENKTA
jgi:hypothetical protein